MVSDLRWKLGFGWTNLALLIILFSLSIYFKGVMRGITGTLFTFICIFTCYRYYQWNSTPWRKVHGRAMLLYAKHASIESSTANRENRSFEIENACCRMALEMCGNNNELNVTIMIGCLSEEQGNYLARLLEDHLISLLPNIQHEAILEIISTAKKIPLCPQLVIANIIENTFGPIEATKYALALLSGEAK